MRLGSRLARRLALFSATFGLLSPTLQADPTTQLETLVRSDAFSEALDLGRSLTDSELTPSVRLWLGIASRATGSIEQASDYFSDLSNDPALDPEIRLTALANLIASGRIEILPNDSIPLAIRYIDEHEESPLLESAFSLLAYRNGLLRSQVSERLEKWSTTSTATAPFVLPGELSKLPPSALESVQPPLSQRTALSDYYRGLSAVSKSESKAAIAAFERFLTRHIDHPLTTAATIRLAEERIRLGRLDAAEEILTALGQQNPRPAVAKHTRYLEACLAFAQGDFDRAREAFLQTHQDDTTLDAPFNAAIAAIHGGDVEAISRYTDALAAAPAMLRVEGQELETELTLEAGLYQVSRSDSLAFEILETFIRERPNHPRVADAELALAEMYLNQVPTQPLSADDRLQSAAKLDLSLAQRETLDYIAIWVQVAAEDSETANIRATRFLQDWPHSRRRTGVLMKLGESHYRAEDYSTASQYFELLFAEQPNSTLAEPALFFAAKSAAAEYTEPGRQRAHSLWDQVVTLGGPLAAHARHEQGLLALSQDRIDDAIEAFESVFELFPTRDLRIAVLCDKGQAAFTKARTQENAPELMRLAIDAFETVERDDTATRAWHFQAAVRRGMCLEALGRVEEAFEIYFGVITEVANGSSKDQTPGSSFLAESDWTHRAGFAAIRILESQESWEDALQIADFLAQSKGPRAAEARNYAERVRLEQFIWEN